KLSIFSYQKRHATREFQARSCASSRDPTSLSETDGRRFRRGVAAGFSMAVARSSDARYRGERKRAVDPGGLATLQLEDGPRRADASGRHRHRELSDRSGGTTHHVADLQHVSSHSVQPAAVRWSDPFLFLCAGGAGDETVANRGRSRLAAGAGNRDDGGISV